VTVIVFVLPAFATLIIIGQPLHLKQWWASLVRALKQKEVWGLVLGAVLSFVLVNIFFWIKAFPEFVNQTLTLQSGRAAVIEFFPSFTGMIYNFALTTGFLKVAFIPMLLALPLALILLNKRSASQLEMLVAFGIITALVVCQFLPSYPRYYISVFPFFLIALALLVPLDAGLLSSDLKAMSPGIMAGLSAFMAVFLIFVSTSAVLTENSNYSEFDHTTAVYTPDAKEAYMETIDYLDSIHAQKVYSVDPMISALAPGIAFTPDFDAYSILWLENESPDTFIQDQISQEVDYIVVSNIWIGNIGPNNIAQELLTAITARCRLVKIINPDSLDFFTIYAVN
jgi:hypothetical protein